MPMEITNTVTIHIEGKPYKTESGQNLLHACLSLGFDVPHFCWHPALGSVGSCRLCAVKRFRDEKDTKGEIIMSCMTPVCEGMRISIQDPDVIRFRAAIIELLMINHPHDCPVCDEGGECHLQDMTVMTGHRVREYRFPKRTHRNQNLGPFINHEMNRCIQCYRCVRFYRNTAGGRDLNVFGAHDHVYFGRHQDGVLESEFSGNLVEICPTGTFTDKTQKAHNTRNWDLQMAPSVCVHCGVGCNTLPGEHYGLLRRVRNRYNHEINGYFLCDRGRFGYEFVNSDRRFRKPLYRQDRNSAQTPMSNDAWINHAAVLLKNPGRTIGIGSPRASLESNAALRALVGPDHFHAGVSASDFKLMDLVRKILTKGPAPAATIQDAAHADAVLVLGEDVTQTAPLLALALRQMGYQKAASNAEKVQLPAWDDAGVREFAQNAKPDLFIVTAQPTRLDDAAIAHVRATPDELATLGFAIQSALNPTNTDQDLPETLAKLASDIAHALKNAERPLVITGTSSGSEAVVQAAANIAWTLCDKGKQASLISCVPECNSMGLALMDCRDLKSAFQSVDDGSADTVIVLENDLYRRAPDHAVDAFLNKARLVVVLDHLRTPTTEKADMVFPVATFAEGSGTLVNYEGRAQQFHAVIAPDTTIRESFRLLAELKTPRDNQWLAQPRRETILADLALTHPLFSPLGDPHPPLPFPALGCKIPRQSFGYSGRTAMNANVTLHEPKPPEDPDSMLAFSMEGYEGMPPADLITHVWAPGWNSVQAVTKYQTTPGGPLNGGRSGVRLLSPSQGATILFFDQYISKTVLNADERLLIAVHHLFGTEELSMASPAIAGQAPEPYLALSPEDHLAKTGTEVNLVFGNTRLTLAVKIMPGLCTGMAGLPVGLPGIPAWSSPMRAIISERGDI